MSLKDALTSDINKVFLNTREFSVNATFGDNTVKGIFDKEYYESDADDFGVGNRQPVFLCKTDSVKNVTKGDIVKIEGTDYKVMMPEPDGTGMTVIRLKSA